MDIKPLKSPEEKYKRRNVLVPKEIKSKKCEYVNKEKKKCKKMASGIIHSKRKVMFLCKEHFELIKWKNSKR